LVHLLNNNDDLGVVIAFFYLKLLAICLKFAHILKVGQEVIPKERSFTETFVYLVKVGAHEV